MIVHSQRALGVLKHDSTQSKSTRSSKTCESTQSKSTKSSKT